MKLEYDVVKPNLYVVKDEVYFGIDRSDVIQVSRSVNEVIEKHIGILKVKESDLEVAKSGKCKNTKCYTVPFREYLDVIAKRGLEEYTGFGGITNDAAALFDLNYLVAAATIESPKEMGLWKDIQRDLADPDKVFDEFDKRHLVGRVDREKTLGEMKRLYEELDSKMPENYAELAIVDGQIQHTEKTVKTKNLGVVYFRQLKAKDKSMIEEAKADLVERLKEVDGPCLSFDAQVIYHQMMNLFGKAPKLIQKYGDVLKSPMWQTRFFRLDP
nr:hypothetical protein [Candidatus Woesearchaeota archaeon]